MYVKFKKKKICKWKHLEVMFVYGKKVHNNVFFNFYIGVDEVCVLLGYDAVSFPKRTDR